MKQTCGQTDWLLVYVSLSSPAVKEVSYWRLQKKKKKKIKPGPVFTSMAKGGISIAVQVRVYHSKGVCKVEI